MRAHLLVSLLTLLALALTARASDAKINDEMTFEKLVDLIRSENLGRIEDVIARLPGEMLDTNYLLMYRSRSLQEATPTEPRAILFTASGKLIITFNGGSPDKRGFNTLEIIQYRDDSRSFEFREIEFGGSRAPKVSQANPVRCTECHQSPTRTNIDMRPNWEPYNIWPGAFGSLDGRPGDAMKNSYRAKETFRPEDKEMLDEQAREPQFVKTFFDSIQPRHPRYRYLKTFAPRMTLDFTDKISKLGFQRVARLIAAEPAAIIEAFGPALASRRDCVDFFKKNKFLSWNFQNAPARYPAFPYSRTTAGQIVGPIFESLGVDTSDWSMDFLTRGRFAFCDRFCAPQYPDSDFVEALNKSFPGIDRYYNRDSCDSTLRELDEKLAPFFAAGTHLELAKRWQPAPADAVGTLRRCANCHTTDVRPGTPVIEFLNQDLLKRALAQAGHAHGTLLDEILYRTGSTASQRLQMPPSHPLAPDEQAALAQYLKTLAL